MQLCELGTPMAVAVGMMDEVRAAGGGVDAARMEKLLGVPVVPVCAIGVFQKNESLNWGEYLGRALSLSGSISMAAMPLGLVLSGALAGPLGIENWFLISGGATLGRCV